MLYEDIFDELSEKKINIDEIKWYWLIFENSLLYYNLELIENPNDFISIHKEKDFSSFSLIPVDQLTEYDIKNNQCWIYLTLSISDILNVLYKKVEYYNSSYSNPTKWDNMNYNNLKIVSISLKKQVQVLDWINIWFKNTYIIDKIEQLNDINNLINKPEKFLSLFISDKISQCKYPWDIKMYKDILIKLETKDINEKLISNLIGYDFNFNIYNNYFLKVFKFDLNKYN